MRVMTVVGTRPELIRLSLIIKELDTLAADHVLVHTGQNFDAGLRDVFFANLDIRQPDECLQAPPLPDAAGQFGQQMGRMFAFIEEVIEHRRPDAVLVLGDTNSALCAMVAARRGIPIYHMEAGNRCYDKGMPEEVNRKIIDAFATFNLPYTSLSRENLLREGHAANRVWVTGNPIFEVLTHYRRQIEASSILTELSATPKQFILATAHRAENVDNPDRLRAILGALGEIGEGRHCPVFVSVHPRLRARLDAGLIAIHPRLTLLHPLGFFDFVQLEKNALCVLTDSGTVQEECCLFHVPAVTFRQSTERPETVECGSNILAGVTQEHIVDCVQLALCRDTAWAIPTGYQDHDVSTKVTQFILGGLTYV